MEKIYLPGDKSRIRAWKGKRGLTPDDRGPYTGSQEEQ